MTENIVTPKEAVAITTKAMSVDRPIFIWGPPGIGKSELIEQIGVTQSRPQAE
jgi:MoxR-like ATPase